MSKSLATLTCLAALFICGSATAQVTIQSATSDYLMAYLAVQHHRASKCGDVLGIQADKAAKQDRMFGLAKPFLNTAELAQFKSGQLQKSLKQEVVPIAVRLLDEARRLGKTDREVCLFVIGYSVGRMQAARDNFRNLGGITPTQ